MGANWANTLRLFKDITPAEHHNDKWEVYAFEANPIIQSYVEKFVNYLNGGGEKPPITVPPSGSTAHLFSYAADFGCPTKSGADQMRECMWKVFEKPLAALAPNPKLNSSELVQQRLAEAKTPLDLAANRSRFTFVPAAVGAVEGWLHLGATDPGQAIRGGAAITNSKSAMSVISTDVVSWMVENFSEDDYVVVKMDVEGAEFDILDSLQRAGKLGLIDLLAMECHGWSVNSFLTRKPDSQLRDCSKVAGLLEEHHVPVMVEGRGYQGFDSESTPELFKPLDPRSV
eukprot:CAMPEP_0178404212 /NCGR_PEP_ID=MMETSP0689_2-20121128/17764_1 /TAXON_ID=160604 /ORGANISM="Amphidinium massartii, Strain CS-259" /LENGTH=285 /DNA_ID=CAMNT_0020025183 /DNA_START=205 /DNA_END=1062 /DNA_ORIENTATION=-